MADPGFQVVYDVTHDGWRVFWFPLVGIGFIILILVVSLLRARGSKRSSAQVNGCFALFGVGFACLWTLIAAVTIGRAYLSDRSALLSGQANYVEGPVENFKPMPYTGHGKESFTVNGEPFSFSDYVVTPGFNRTASHGGPIHAGLYVRIWYVDDDIVKLEIPK